eukprot:SM009270S24381  [mRNA]  locus=s9270:91:585:+ [translate_table: standard]
MTPFVLELLEMLHNREPHERSLEQSLFDKRVTCYGYYDHVIKERQLTIYECVGTLDEQFANGILLLVDLVIVYGDYWTLSDLGGDGPLASRAEAALALAYYLRNTMQCAFVLCEASL